MLKEKETGEGADPPRVMALDDYFESDGQVRLESNETVYLYYSLVLLNVNSLYFYLKV